MSVDYRLLPHFQASRERYEAARRALPQRWLTDPRPEVQYLNELWIDMIARAGEDQDDPELPWLMAAPQRDPTSVPDEPNLRVVRVLDAQNDDPHMHLHGARRRG